MSSFTPYKAPMSAPKTPRVYTVEERDASGTQLDTEDISQLRSQLQKFQKDRVTAKSIYHKKGFNKPFLTGHFDAEVEEIEQLAKEVSDAGLPKILVMDYYTQLRKKRHESLKSFHTAVKAMSAPEEVSLDELNKFTVLS